MSHEQGRLEAVAIDDKPGDEKTRLENEMKDRQPTTDINIELKGSQQMKEEKSDFEKINYLMEGEPQHFRFISELGSGPSSGEIFIEDDPYKNVKDAEESENI